MRLDIAAMLVPEVAGAAAATRTLLCVAAARLRRCDTCWEAGSRPGATQLLRSHNACMVAGALAQDLHRGGMIRALGLSAPMRCSATEQRWPDALGRLCAVLPAQRVVVDNS